MNDRPETLETQEIKPKKTLRRFVNPKVFLFLVALFNYVWYFSGSASVNRWLHDSIVFCLVCPWYWDWTFTNPPSLLLIAACCMLYGRWIGYLAAFLTSIYVIFDGIAWLSNPKGFIWAMSQRIDVIVQQPEYLSTLRDLQYLFAIVMLIVSVIYLMKEV